MKSTKILFFILVNLFLNASSLLAQSGCTLEVKAVVTNVMKGKSSGTIEIQIEGDDKNGRFKVFLLNKGSEIAREEIKDRKVERVEVGIYEFIIIDTKGDKCFKELTVQVQEAK